MPYMESVANGNYASFEGSRKNVAIFQIFPVAWEAKLVVKIFPV